jgi:hypothetical protein
MSGASTRLQQPSHLGFDTRTKNKPSAENLKHKRTAHLLFPQRKSVPCTDRQIDVHYTTSPVNTPSETRKPLNLSFGANISHSSKRRNLGSHSLESNRLYRPLSPCRRSSRTSAPPTFVIATQHKTADQT